MMRQCTKTLIGILSLLVSSCTNDNKDLAKYINKINARSGKKVVSIPPAVSLPAFKIPENNRRNPFKPLEQISVVNQKRTKRRLEQFPLNSLKFVGTLKQGNKIWALIKQPDQQVSLIKVGQYMGKNGGKVLLIENDYIQVEETLSSSRPWRNRRTMKLYTKSGGGS